MTGQEGDGDIHENPQSRTPIKESHGHAEILPLFLLFHGTSTWSEPPSIIGIGETNNR